MHTPPERGTFAHAKGSVGGCAILQGVTGRYVDLFSGQEALAVARLATLWPENGGNNPSSKLAGKPDGDYRVHVPAKSQRTSKSTRNADPNPSPELRGAGRKLRPGDEPGQRAPARLNAQSPIRASQPAPGVLGAIADILSASARLTRLLASEEYGGERGNQQPDDAA